MTFSRRTLESRNGVEEGKGQVGLAASHQYGNATKYATKKKTYPLLISHDRVTTGFSPTEFTCRLVSSHFA